MFPGEVEGRVKGDFISCPIKVQRGLPCLKASEIIVCRVRRECVIFYPHGWEQEKKESITVNFTGSLRGARTSGMILAATNWLGWHHFVCLGAQEKPSSKEVPERTSSQWSMCGWTGLDWKLPAELWTPQLPDQQTNGTSKNVFPLKYTHMYNSSGHYECVLKVDENQTFEQRAMFSGSSREIPSFGLVLFHGRIPSTSKNWLWNTC